jgi:ferredoxin
MQHLTRWQKPYLPEILRGMAVTTRHFFANLFRQRHTVTQQYPEQPTYVNERCRGRHLLMREEDGSPGCTACMLCATSCPALCIHIVAGEHDDPSVATFEREVWSENPTAPPDVIDPSETALAAADGTYSHSDLLEAAASVVDDYVLDTDSAVAVRASLARPGTVVAGVLAPLLAGGTILLDRDATGTLAVTEDAAPEEQVVSPDAVL